MPDDKIEQLPPGWEIRVMVTRCLCGWFSTSFDNPEETLFCPSCGRDIRLLTEWWSEHHHDQLEKDSPPLASTERLNQEFADFLTAREHRLGQLLSFIRNGLGFLGPGIYTYPTGGESQEAIFKDCLELERRGQIYRAMSDTECVVWMPVPEGAEHIALEMWNMSDCCRCDDPIVEEIERGLIVRSKLLECRKCDKPLDPSDA